MKAKEFQKIGEHVYYLPPVPKSKKDILFWDNTIEQQFWLRIEFPQLFLDYVPQYTEFDQSSTSYDDDGVLKSLNPEDSTLIYNLLIQERKRRKEGVWFYNKGIPTYITGSHYFLLQWCKVYAVNALMDFKEFKELFGIDTPFSYYTQWYADYGRYVEFQRDIFYLLDLVDNEKNSAGLFLTKAKKTGVTMLMACHLLNLGTLNKNKQLAIMSKKTKDAIEVNFLYMYHAFMGLPKAFQPMYSNLPKEKGEIFFGAKIFRGTSKKGKALSQQEQNEALNTKIKCVATALKAFDSPVQYRAWIDEPTKIFEESNLDIQELYDTSLATVKIQQKITGKIYLTCYVSEGNDEGVDICRKIYFDSKLKTIKGGDNRTKSEMYCHHISALYSDFESIDKYGICDEKSANNKIEMAIERAKSDSSKSGGKKLQSVQRQNARNENEAWSISGTKSIFNPVQFGRQILNIEEQERDNPSPLWTYGYLKWNVPLWEIGKKNKRPLGKISNVIFVPANIDTIDNEEMCKVAVRKQPNIDLLNMPNKLGKDEQNNYIRPDKLSHFSGFDPVNYSSDYIEGSMISGYTINGHDEGLNTRTKSIESKIIVSKYFFRNEDPDENFEDILKYMVYFGGLYVVEGNSSHTAERLIKEGFANYMVFRDEEKVLTLFKQWFKYPQDCYLVKRAANGVKDDLMDYMLRLAKEYFEVIPNEPNYLKECFDKELLNGFLTFDPTNTRPSDRQMAFLYTLLSYDVYMNAMLQGQDDEYSSEKNYSSILSALST